MDVEESEGGFAYVTRTAINDADITLLFRIMRKSIRNENLDFCIRQLFITCLRQMLTPRMSRKNLKF